ncbi:heavy metal translocating P-type ATPase [Sulfitobacter sp. JB4-11]|uniref:heavy metal translocating P-type ATPase n=1 Tax=Sulfitobacter rhodophyticola TaxID=3238304 RepID=UPI0035181943
MATSAPIILPVSNMHCGACVGRVNKVLTGIPGTQDVNVNLANETAQFTATEPDTLARVLAALEKAGYPACPQTEDTKSIQSRSKETMHDLRIRFLFAAIMTLPVFVLEMGSHMIPALHHLIMRTIGMEASWGLQFAFTSMVLIGPGRDMLGNGLRALRRGAPDMNSLVALGAGAAWSYSTVALLAPDLLPVASRVVYFEAAAVIVTLILMGRWFEARAKGRTGAALRTLIGLQPDTATVKRDGEWLVMPIADLTPGDIIRIPPGARVPTDAVLVTGSSAVDESMLTGEPMAVPKTSGDMLTGGTVNGTGALEAEVRAIGADTALARIIDMVRQAQGARLPIQGLVDQITLWFVPTVLVIAAATVAVWLMLGPGLAPALVAGVSVLIIACPCAMGLATPTSIMVGTGAAAERGVLFRQGDALQGLSDVDVVAFDKTGTLTEGCPTLTTLRTPAGVTRMDALSVIAGAEAQSEHSIARAIVDAAKAEGVTPLAASEFTALTGQGARARVEGGIVLIGNQSLMKAENIDITAFEEEAERLSRQGQTVFFAARKGLPLALLAVSDPVRETSKTTIENLERQGIKVAMLTGDSAPTAQAVADTLGISRVMAGLSPDGKQQALDSLRGEGRLAFVGDGINDAPVLARADVGIAIGTGTDVAIETADVVLMSGDPAGVLTALEVSHATLRNIRQNLGWAFGYNVLLIPVAAGVLYPSFGLLLSPILAAAAMAFSSVFVLGNALRLRSLGVRP